MEEIRRIHRTMVRAQKALKSLHEDVGIDDQFDAWEVFLSEWRKGLNQISDHFRNTGRNSDADSMHLDRLGSQLLDYVWEARNLEEHKASGSQTTTALEKSVVPWTFGGQPLVLNGVRIMAEVNRRVLTFRPIAIKRNGNDIILPAPTMSVQEVADAAMDMLIKWQNSVSA